MSKRQSIVFVLVVIIAIDMSGEVLFWQLLKGMMLLHQPVMMVYSKGTSWLMWMGLSMAHVQGEELGR
jgi:hypothetical protein